MRIKLLKCIIVTYVLLMFYFCFINPWGCDCYQRDFVSRSKMKAQRIYAEIELIKADGQDPWPHTPRETTVDSEPRIGGEYASSAAFFDWLLNTGVSDTENCKGKRISLVVLDDADTAITPDNVMWSIAEGVNDETPDCAIVLVSANFDCSQLLSAYDGSADLPMVTSDGKPAIFVPKNGAPFSLGSEFLNARNLYQRQAFTCGPKSYLTPKGRVWTDR